jgi:hypothetical protein
VSAVRAGGRAASDVNGAELDRKMNTVALRSLAKLVEQELGPTFEGRVLVAWLVASSHPEYARVSLPNEVRRVGCTQGDKDLLMTN